MTTEGSAEVPQTYREFMRVYAWPPDGDVIFAAGEAAERTRLEARLAEVEAERDEVTRQMLAQSAALGDRTLRIAALRAAVRPLVEAAKAIESARTFDLGWRGEGEPPRCIEVPAVVWRAFIAALADPAIAALLEGGNDAH